MSKKLECHLCNKNFDFNQGVIVGNDNISKDIGDAPEFIFLDTKCAIQVLQEIKGTQGIKATSNQLRQILNMDVGLENEVYNYVVSSKIPAVNPGKLRLVASNGKSVNKKYKRVKNKKNKEAPQKIQNPADVVKALDKVIIGQDEAKKSLALAVLRHSARTIKKNNLIKKGNLLITGPTGTGKTEMVNTLSEYLKTPFVKVDCSQFSPSGYKGDSISSIFQRLLAAANNDMEVAKRGIVLLDEIDKLSPRYGGEFKQGVQYELLKVIEGGDFVMEDKEGTIFNTENVLFVCAGAFTAMDKIVKPSGNNSSKIGFGIDRRKSTLPPEIVDIYSQVNATHLIEYGIVPELVGRFEFITHTRALTRDNFMSILKNSSKSPLKDIQALFSAMDKTVTFTKEYLEKVVDKAYGHKSGVRSLNLFINKDLQDIIFCAQSMDTYKINISSKFIEEFNPDNAVKTAEEKLEESDQCENDDHELAA